LRKGVLLALSIEYASETPTRESVSFAVRSFKATGGLLSLAGFHQLRRLVVAGEPGLFLHDRHHLQPQEDGKSVWLELTPKAAFLMLPSGALV